VDSLPANLTYVKGKWGILEANGAVIREISDLKWEVSNITSGSYISIWLAVTVNVTETGSITNVVNVNSRENKTNVTGNETVEVVPVKLNVTKEILDPIGKIYINGSDIWYLITVTNSGEAFANNVTVVDELPEGLVYRDYHVDEEYAEKIIGFENIDNKTVTWTIDGLDVGEEIYIYKPQF